MAGFRVAVTLVAVDMNVVVDEITSTHSSGEQAWWTEYCGIVLFEWWLCLCACLTANASTKYINVGVIRSVRSFVRRL